MKILSLFDGISCGRVALERAGIQVDKYFASEIDKYAIQIAKKNYPDTIHIGSVTDVSAGNPLLGLTWKEGERTCVSHINKIDLLMGGSPCQDLSIAKKGGKGLEGEKSGLFYEYVRILNEVKPKYFLLENVASMKKADRDKITEILGVEPVMINSALLSAQNRKRLYWVGKWNGESYDTVVIPQPEDKGVVLKDILEPPGEVDEKYSIIPNERFKLKGLCDNDGKSKSIAASYYKGYGNDTVTLVRSDADIPSLVSRSWFYCYECRKKIVVASNGMITECPHYPMMQLRGRDTIRVGHFNSGGQGDRVYSDEGKSVSLSANGGGRGAKTGLYQIKLGNIYPKGGQAGNVYSSEGKSATLTHAGRGGADNAGLYEIPPVIRKLTPIECERLQTLPDNYSEGISNTQRYKAIGNGWTVDVISHIFIHLND